MVPIICATLPVFHALTGCDTVSAFSGRGKKTAWNTWEVIPEVTEAFEDLLLMQQDMSEATLALLERFVVLLYDRTKKTTLHPKVEKPGEFATKSRGTQAELAFSLTAGTKHYFPTKCFQVQQTGAGNWVQQGGSHCGQFSLKHHCPAMS